jgi:hypothetical protein
MEGLLQTLKAILLLPVGALLYMPFLRLAARFLDLKRLSFGAAFMLGLILGAVLLIADLVIGPFIAGNTAAAFGISAFLSLAISTAVCGYFLTTVDGRSAGLLKGFLFTLVSQALFGVALMALAALLVLLFGSWRSA